MAPEADPLALLGRQADERLLGEDLVHLPPAVGQPPEGLPESAARRQVVRAGATMTGVTLIGGAALSLAGAIELVVNGGVLWLAVLVLGVVLVSTHWGWVHIAELTGNRIEAQRGASWAEHRRAWLGEIEPYPRWEVATSVGADGSITILTACHRPVPRGEHTFTFVREEVAREAHSGDEPAAAVTERAEALRRQAALDTQEARERYETARGAYEHALFARDDEEQRLAAIRAASEALSERINTNLREPPLVE